MFDAHPIRRFLLAAGFLLACCSTPALASAPMAKTQAPAFRRFMLGEFEITALSDGTSMLPASQLLQGDPARIASALHEAHLGDKVETSHNCYLVNTGPKLVLIDAGAGSLLGPGNGRLVGNIRASGYRPDQIDEVYITHLHADHVGGLMTNGQRTFPNAIVRADKRDVDYWLNEANMRAAPEAAKRFFQGATVSITPYQQAGKLVTFNGDSDLIPGVRARAAYGHTPGHTMFLVESKGEKLMLWGDVVHVAAVQFAQPSVTIGFDVEASEARRVRQALFEQISSEHLLIGGAHIAFPGLGYVRRLGTDSYGYEPIVYSETLGKD